MVSQIDLLSIDMRELNVSKKCRGKKQSQQHNIIPTNIVRRHCASKVSEISDLTGKIALITKTMKLHLHRLALIEILKEVLTGMTCYLMN